MSLPVCVVDAFADRPFTGNPAAVVFLDGPRDDAWRAAVAREFNLAETAFVEAEGAAFRLRWFTPAVEVELCGHATLASAHALWESGRLSKDRARIEPVLPVERIFSDADVLMLGEMHNSLDSIEIITREMPRFKASGVTVVGIEGLKTPDQAAMDDYLEGRTGFPELSHFDTHGPRGEAFLLMFEAAKREGIRVIAIDKPLPEWGRVIADRAAEATGRSVKSFGGRPLEQMKRAAWIDDPALTEAVDSVVLAERNVFMAEATATEMKGGKAVLLVGEAHLPTVEGLEFTQWGRSKSHFGSIARELERSMLTTFSVTVTGGLFTGLYFARGHAATIAPIYDLVEEALPTGASGFVSMSDRMAIYHMGPAREPDPASSRTRISIRPEKYGIFEPSSATSSPAAGFVE